MDYKRLVAKQSSGVFVSRFMGYILAFAVQWLFARLLGSQNFGAYILTFSMANILALFAMLGMPTGLLKFSGEYMAKNELGKIKGIFKTSFLISTISTLIIIGIIVIFHGIFLSKVFKSENYMYLVWTSIFLIMNVGYQNMNGIISGLKKPAVSAFYKETLERVLRISAFLVLFHMGFEFLSPFLATTMSMVTILLLLFLRLRRELSFLKDVEVEYEIKRFLSYSLSMFLVGLSYFFMENINRIIVGIYLTASQVAYYSIASVVASLVTFFLNSINAIFAPVISTMYYSGEIAKLGEMYSTLTRWITTFTIPLYTWMVIFSRDILGFFGKDYEIASAALIALATGQFINAIVGSNGLLLAMTGNQKYELFNGVLTASLNIALNMMLVPKYEILGSAIGGAAAVAGVNVLKLIEVLYVLKMFPYNIKFLRPAALVPFIIAVDVILKAINQLYALFIALIVNYLIYITLGFKSDERRFLLKILRITR